MARVTLCATQRLARNLQIADGQRQAAAGARVWPTRTALTVDAWLARLGEQIALSAAVAATEVPARILSPFEEALVWRRVIEADAGALAIDLFDRHSLARTAAEAHALMTQWQLRVDASSAADGSEELQRFVVWRRAFLDTCRRHDWLDAARYRQRVCEWIERGCGTLPAQVELAGFDAPPPQLQRLQAALVARGVSVVLLPPVAVPAPRLQVRSCKDATDECQAAVAWARQILADRPAARLGLVVSDLELRRPLLVPLLDALLQPDLLHGASDAAPVRYNLSLGLPLLRQGLVATALALLRALATPQGMAPHEFGALLRLPYGLADGADADLGARLDDELHQRPGQQITLNTVLRLTHGLAQDDCPLLRHLRALAAAQAAARPARLPSAWAGFFQQQLARLGWPGERSLTSTEFQVRAAWLEVLAAFAALDEFLGNITASTAVAELVRLCGEKIFQPKTPGQPPLQVLGMLEAAGAAFDALWVMGMNDDRWPPPPQPNPLLPAALQRRHATPNASAEVQAAFARRLHDDLLRTAPDITFSHAEKDGERSLRPSPLLAGLPLAAHDAAAESAAALPGFEYIDDALAPPVADQEQVAGGSGLLRAQALCPAWAFYRYRLGAKALDAPAEGLDAAQRGKLVHAVLEAFWNQVRDLAGLQALRDAALAQAVAVAVETALGGLEVQLGEALTPTLRRLEAERLQRLCLQWLRVEWDAQTGAGRQPFTVLGCEEKHTVTLGRLAIRLVIDRIDMLAADGRRIVIDYKTGGGKPSPAHWQDARLREPQLPLYAAFVLAGADDVSAADTVAAVAFARVRNGECAFTGLAVADGLLPGVAAVPQAGEDAQSAWQALLDTWRAKILLLADEIQRGEAAVRFDNERDLAHCEVLPLLRLAERRQQFEQSQGAP